MIGKYDIEIYNNRIHYFLTVKRNITLLRGDSATGKSELLRLIRDYEENGRSSGITIRCDRACTVLTNVGWEIRLQSLQNHIVFIDETAGFLKLQRFAELVRGSDNYFVIISRDDLSQLPYSIEEIYGLRNVSETQKYRPFRKVYNEMFRLYNLPLKDCLSFTRVILEDSNSGYELFSRLYPERCISARGKSHVYETVSQNKEDSLLVIVDGAAFGPEIGKLMEYVKCSTSNCVIYAPESFEFLLLQSGLFEVPDGILNETYLYADSRKYISWEEFFTSYLSDITRNTVFQYGKAKLNPAYMTAGALKRIMESLPPQIRQQ